MDKAKKAGRPVGSTTWKKNGEPEHKKKVGYKFTPTADTWIKAHKQLIEIMARRFHVVEKHSERKNP